MGNLCPQCTPMQTLQRIFCEHSFIFNRVFHRKKKPTSNIVQSDWLISDAIKKKIIFQRGKDEINDNNDKDSSEKPTKKGAPTVFSSIEEQKIKNFLLDCWRMGLPRSEKMLGYDIQNMIIFHDKLDTVLFTNGIPGKNIYCIKKLYIITCIISSIRKKQF